MTHQNRNKVLPQIINFAAQYQSAHNDGWTQKHFKEYLEANRDYINEVLGERRSDGLEGCAIITELEITGEK